MLCSKNVEYRKPLVQTHGLEQSVVTSVKIFGLNVVFHDKVEVPKTLGLTLNGQLVFTIKKDLDGRVPIFDCSFTFLNSTRLKAKPYINMCS